LNQETVYNLILIKVAQGYIGMLICSRRIELYQISGKDVVLNCSQYIKCLKKMTSTSRWFSS